MHYIVKTAQNHAGYASVVYRYIHKTCQRSLNPQYDGRNNLEHIYE